jgi:hypothetical protein
MDLGTGPEADEGLAPDPASAVSASGRDDWGHAAQLDPLIDHLARAIERQGRSLSVRPVAGPLT